MGFQGKLHLQVFLRTREFDNNDCAAPLHLHRFDIPGIVGSNVLVQLLFLIFIDLGEKGGCFTDCLRILGIESFYESAYSFFSS